MLYLSWLLRLVVVLFEYFPSRLLPIAGEKVILSRVNILNVTKHTSITIYKQLRYTDIHRPKYIFFTEKLRMFFRSHLHIFFMVHFFLIFCFHHRVHKFFGYVLLRRNKNFGGWSKTFYAFCTSKWQLLFLHPFLTSFCIFHHLGFNEKSVIVLSNSCEKLYQVLSYPFWQSLHFFISFYTIHICYITNVYGAADIEIERLSGGFKQAQTHTNII